MKFSFVISAHPSTEERTSVLERCATSIKRYNPEATVIAAGHCFPTRDLSHCIDFYVMEKKNEMLTAEDIFELSSNNSLFYWWYFQDAEITKMFLTRGEILALLPVHHYAAFKNIYNGFKMAEQLGFTYSVSCDADVEFHSDDLRKFEIDCEEIMSNGEDGMVFLAKTFGAFDSAIFFSNVNTLLDFSGKVRTKEDYKRLMRGEGFLVERFLVKLRDSMLGKRERGRESYRMISHEEIDEASKAYFRNSRMNEPNTETIDEIPIFSVCTRNPVEGFGTEDWVQRNFLFFQNDTSSRKRNYYLFFMQRGKRNCDRAEMIFAGERGEKRFVFEDIFQKTSELRDLPNEEIMKIFELQNVTLTCNFFYGEEMVTRSFRFNDSETLNKYFELNQILFE